MTDTKLIQELNPIFFIIWTILMLYGFYRYYKNKDFKQISLLHFVVVSAVITLCGFISGALFLDIGFLILFLLIPSLSFELINVYLIGNPAVCTGCLLCIYLFYRILQKISNPYLLKLVLFIFMSNLLALGSIGFFFIGKFLCF